MSDLDFEVMLAKNYDPKRVQSWKGIYTEPKLDGVRVIVLMPSFEEVRKRFSSKALRACAQCKGKIDRDCAEHGTRPRYYSRNGRELGMFTHLDPSIRKLGHSLAKGRDMRGGLMFDTEAVGMTFGDVSGAIHTKGTVALTCRLHVFHAMPLECFHKGLDDLAQIDRIERLQLAVEPSTIKGITVSEPNMALDHRQVMQAHKEHRKINPVTGKPYYEGTMVKNLRSAWTATRSWAWMKIKDSITTEVTVTGLKEGTGKYVGMCGALIGDYNGRKVRVSGMTDKQREEFWSKPKSIVGKLVEVESQEETEHGSLRHPRFIRVRDDKEE